MDMKAEGSRNPSLPVDGGSISRPLTESANCAACQKPIRERYLLKALDQFWHEDCLKCACCDCRLGEVGSTLFTKANLILCKRDYLSQAETRLQTSLPVVVSIPLRIHRTRPPLLERQQQQRTQPPPKQNPN
ncbi:LIM domain only protein 3 [Caerostris darwini]|uniref:LIM domain only protein 3 n=1 Tax=Caerostris darwini TaxID=1538125 RepID=A0AAV4W4M7_9ARAC|nr:LIM domain only protein 3 [Caerostris darwini]